MIEWLQFNEFERRLEELECFGSFCFNQEIAVDITFSELQELIPVCPTSNPTECDEPGSCERWYGCAHEQLFWITHSHHPQNSNYTLIRTCLNHPRLSKYNWSVLEKLIVLPSPLLSRISWIGSSTNQPHKSIFSKNKYGIICEVYQT